MGNRTYIGRGRRGFTIAELIAGVLVVVVLAAVVAPTLAQPRRAARLHTSQDNLRFWGVASATYTLDFAGLMPTYSWRDGETYMMAGYQGEDEAPITIPPDDPGRNSHNMQAKMNQETDLLRRLTGRVTGPGKILAVTYSPWPQRRRTHLVMSNYMGLGVTDRRAADPADRNQLVWQRDPIAFEQGEEYPEPTTGGEDVFKRPAAIQRWPYSSSYQVTVSSFCFDQENGAISTASPLSETCNQFSRGRLPFGNRHAIEVIFPANKVFMFEWHDRHSSVNDLWYAYPQARPNKLMFDGSVQDRPTEEAGRGFFPNDPDNPDAPSYRYTRLTTDPPAVGDSNTYYPVWYRFTRGGLAGIDYAP